jgi:luciferase family oxidoreductase group 1
MKVGILDVAGLIEETVELAPLADQLGFHRYWIAEHQPQPSPILIAGLVAGLTERIRVGTAGILFHYYAPRRTAHDFHFLERAFAGRIDAGFCGGISLVPEELGAPVPDMSAAYPDRVGALVHHLRNTPGSEGFDSKTAWVGAMEAPPQIWSLGGGGRSADLAARHGLCFGYDFLFRISRDEPATVAAYREAFVPHATQPAPLTAIALAGMCAETDAAAEALAAAYPGRYFAPRVVGSGPTCAAALRAVRDRFGTDEVVFADLVAGVDARKRQLEVLAAALDLRPGGAA